MSHELVIRVLKLSRKFSLSSHTFQCFAFSLLDINLLITIDNMSRYVFEYRLLRTHLKKY